MGLLSNFINLMNSLSHKIGLNDSFTDQTDSVLWLNLNMFRHNMFILYDFL